MWEADCFDREFWIHKSCDIIKDVWTQVEGEILYTARKLSNRHDKYAGEKSPLDMYRVKLVKLLLFFLKHSGSVNV